jgi:hypothetical protein
VSGAALSAPIIEAMNLALEDERDALAIYEVIMVRFGDIRPFSNIARAEERHISAMPARYKRYGITPPDTLGVPDPSSATEELLALCQLGVDAENENTRLYDEELLPAVADYPDIAQTMHRLRDASWNNHKQAFERCVARGGRPGSGGRRYPI